MYLSIYYLKLATRYFCYLFYVLTDTEYRWSEVKLLSRVWLFVTPWAVAYKAPLSTGILQARILEWVAISSSRGSSQHRDQTPASHIAGRCFTLWATREALFIILS